MISSGEGGMTLLTRNRVDFLLLSVGARRLCALIIMFGHVMLRNNQSLGDSIHNAICSNLSKTNS